MRNLNSLCLFFLLIILLAACNTVAQPSNQQSVPVVIITDESSASVKTAYPMENEPDSYIGTTYPMGQAPTKTTTPLDLPGDTPETQKTPMMNADKAAVYGVLNSYSDKLPLQGVMVYAADVVVVEPSGDKVYTTQEKSSPQSSTDAIGQFMITDITPGTYYFMMVTPFGNYPLFDEKSNTFEIELEGGDVLNFGEVFVNWP